MTAPDHPTQSISGANANAAAGFGRDLTQTAAAQRYILGKEIERGGMGIIYRAADTVLGREVAVKVLHEKYCALSEAALRFAGEARITGQLQHPSIPPVHDLGTLSDGRPFLAMKLIKGQTLDESLKRPTRRSGRPRPARGGLRADLPGTGLCPLARRHPPRPEAGQRDGRGIRRGAGDGLGPGQDPWRGAIEGETDRDPKRSHAGVAADQPVIGNPDGNAKGWDACADRRSARSSASSTETQKDVTPGVDPDQPDLSSGIADGGGEHAGHPGVRASGAGRW